MHINFSNKNAQYFILNTLNHFLMKEVNMFIKEHKKLFAFLPEVIKKKKSNGK